MVPFNGNEFATNVDDEMNTVQQQIHHIWAHEHFDYLSPTRGRIVQFGATGVGTGTLPSPELIYAKIFKIIDFVFQGVLIAMGNASVERWTFATKISTIKNLYQAGSPLQLPLVLQNDNALCEELWRFYVDNLDPRNADQHRPVTIMPRATEEGDISISVTDQTTHRTFVVSLSRGILLRLYSAFRAIGANSSSLTILTKQSIMDYITSQPDHSATISQIISHLGNYHADDIEFLIDRLSDSSHLARNGTTVSLA